MKRWRTPAVLIALAWLWIASPTIARLAQPSTHPIELAASYEAWQQFSRWTGDQDPWIFLRSQGISTLTTAQLDPAHVAWIRSQGFRVGAIVSPLTPQSHLRELQNALILLDESEAQGSSAFIQYLCRRPLLRFGNVEFSKAPSLKWLPPSHQPFVVSVHDIAPQQLQELSTAGATARFLRSVYERQVDVLIINPHPALATSSQQQEWISQLISHLRRIGGTFDRPTVTAPSRWSLAAARIIVWMAWSLAVATPLLLGWWLSQNRFNASGTTLDAFAAYGIACTGTLTAGLVIAQLLHDPLFQEKIVQFPAVKLSLILPLAGMTLVFMKSQWKTFDRFWRQPTLNYQAAWIALGGLGIFSALAIMLLRSGHSALPSFPMETTVRELLERWLTARPRFKEFLIGYPALVAYVACPPTVRISANIRWGLLLIGLIGPISTLNTFCHAHAPLTTSLLRSIHGFWLGGLIGMLGLFSVKAIWKTDAVR